MRGYMIIGMQMCSPPLIQTNNIIIKKTKQRKRVKFFLPATTISLQLICFPIKPRTSN